MMTLRTVTFISIGANVFVFPQGTAGLSIDVSLSPQQDFSDTESDFDDKELIRRK